MRKLFASAIFLIGIGCAEKNYVQSSGDGAGPQKPVGDCDIRFQLPVSKSCVGFSWEKVQEGRRPGIGLLKIWRPNRADKSPVPVDAGEVVEVILWMPHMGGGHGSDPVTVEPVDVGTYRLRRVFFSMPGQWEIRVFVKSGGNVVDQIYLPFTY